MSAAISLRIGRVMTTRLEDLVKREEGQGVTEYGIVLAFVAVALAAVLVALHTAITTFIGNVGTTSATCPAPSRPQRTERGEGTRLIRSP